MPAGLLDTKMLIVAIKEKAYEILKENKPIDLWGYHDVTSVACVQITKFQEERSFSTARELQEALQNVAATSLSMAIKLFIDAEAMIAARKPLVAVDDEKSYYQPLFNAIRDTNGIPLVSEMQEIIDVVHKYYPQNNTENGNNESNAEKA